MNYIGSKHSLLDFIEGAIDSVVVDKKPNYSLCDAFAGTGSVGLHFKKKGHKIFSNDVQYYSYVLNRHYIGNHRSLKFEQLSQIIPDLPNAQNKQSTVCTYLQGIKGIDGFIFKNYCPNGTKNQRLYFTAENGKKCDAIRLRIEQWKQQNLITPDEYFFLLASLLESIDKTANTASVYGAFLKNFKKSALKPLEYKPAPLYINDIEHEVHNQDINTIIAQISSDVLYLDPPYNARQYAANYHILETIARYDNPQIRGKTGLREYSGQRSAYCSKAKVVKAFSNLIANSKSKYIFLSYNNEGLMSLDDIKNIMSQKGKYGMFSQSYSRFKADSNRSYTANHTTEYLHYVICNE